jgi:chromosome segregation ATPase
MSGREQQVGLAPASSMSSPDLSTNIHIYIYTHKRFQHAPPKPFDSSLFCSGSDVLGILGCVCRIEAGRSVEALESERRSKEEITKAVTMLENQLMQAQTSIVAEREEWGRAAAAWSNELRGMRGERDAVLASLESVRGERDALSKDLGEAKGRERNLRGQVDALQANLGAAEKERDIARDHARAASESEAMMRGELGLLKEQAHAALQVQRTIYKKTRIHS